MFNVFESFHARMYEYVVQYLDSSFIVMLSKLNSSLFEYCIILLSSCSNIIIIISAKFI